MYLYKIKFSELSLDMFRMLQSCEREPSSKNDKNNNQRLQNISNTTTDTSHINTNQASDSLPMGQFTFQRENPHKYLLYKPSFGQFYSYISAAFKELLPMRIMMLYISADGFEPLNKKQINRI